MEQVNPDDLRIQPRAHFYELDTSDLSGMEGRLRAALLAASPTHKEESRGFPTIQLSGGLSAQCGFVVREQNGAPAFLPDGDLKERWFSLTLLVVVDEHLVVHTTGGARWSDAHVAEWAHRVDPRRVSQFLSGKRSRFERVSMRGMSLNRNVIRARSYEALVLQSSLSPLGMNRQVVNGVRCRIGDRIFTANPASALIGESGDRLELSKFADWASGVIRLLPKKPKLTGFLTNFAQLVDVPRLLDEVTPLAAMVDMGWLRDGRDDGTLRLDIHDKGGLRPATMPETERVIERLSSVAECHRIEKTDNFSLVLPKADPEEGDVILAAAKKSFSITGSLVSRFSVYDMKTHANASLRQRIRDEEALLVSMDNLEYAFAFGKLFRDQRAYSFAPRVLEMLHPVASLAKCNAEKGEKMLGKSHKCFSAGSVFRVVEDEIAEENVLICDDLGDEWADFIGIDDEETGSSRVQISLYHAKHGEKSLSATNFHEVVGQALKNLGRISATAQDLSAKKATWSKTWQPKKCAISRLRRPKALADAMAAYGRASASPACLRRVCLVATFLSASALRDLVEAVSPSETLVAHEAQLVQLLLTFMSSTLEVGALPVIYCAP